MAAMDDEIRRLGEREFARKQRKAVRQSKNLAAARILVRSLIGELKSRTRFSKKQLQRGVFRCEPNLVTLAASEDGDVAKGPGNGIPNEAWLEWENKTWLLLTVEYQKQRTYVHTSLSTDENKAITIAAEEAMKASDSAKPLEFVYSDCRGAREPKLG